MPRPPASFSADTGGSGLRGRLRAALKETHDRIEELAFSRAIVEERVDAPAYGRLLSQLLPVHAELERQLALWLAREPRLGAISPAKHLRHHLLLGDLAGLGLEQEEPSPAARFLAESVAAESQTLAGFLGCLYVVGGSRMGGLVLHKHLARALGVPREPGRGLDYHLEGMREFPALWGRTIAVLEGLVEEDHEPQAIAAAVATMRGFYGLYDSLGAALSLAEAAV